MRKHAMFTLMSLFGLAIVFLFVPIDGFAQKIKISKATPDWAEQGAGTTGTPFEVTINGEGLVDISGVRFLVAGSRNDTGGIQVRYFVEDNSEQVRAYIEIDDAAALEYFDIEMTTLRGRRGKGNTLFKVVEPGGSPYSGERIDLKCALGATFGDLSDDTVKADGEPGVHADVYGAYVNAEEKVQCRTGGTVQPNLSGLGLDSRLKGGPPKRKIDLVLSNFEDPDGSTVLSPYLPSSIFEEGPDWNAMEIAYLKVRPYRHARPANDYRDAAPAQDHIQLLTPDTSYSMASRIRVKPVDVHRYVINLADAESGVVDDQFTGLLCHSVTPGWPNEEIVKVSQDLTVYLWPDADQDGLPDGYTVTTGEVPSSGGNAGVNFTLEYPPVVVSTPRTAAICSQEGPVDCSDRSVGGYCNFLGFADVEFTWHAENQ